MTIKPNTSKPYQKEKQLALATTMAAAKICQRVRQEQQSQGLQKADSSPVTIADFAAQAVICQLLKEAFPQDSIIAEEDAAMLQTPELAATLTGITSQVTQIIPNATETDVINWINQGNGQVAPRYWTLDPIDGTKGFIRGDQYAVALALVEEGEVKVGAIACPALPFDFQQPGGNKGVIFIAVKGQGSTAIAIDSQNQAILKTNKYKDIQKLKAIQSVETAHSDRNKQKEVAEQLGITQPPISMDSLAKYAAIARGEADIYLRIPLPQYASLRENIWDHGAGVIVLEEAGGKVTDLDGKVLDFSFGPKLTQNRGIVASNGVIHGDVLQVIKSILQ